ncbi:LytR/AlgR family response regulator transcription factor [Jiulongibacter sp. NS-SX5]|uniref:LytR/AlgR family response regulator transcription factor n=1 Tax=Jiulongibacter sp. NS-SX5 TaxID=3463854 RepID=UPI00405891BD
MNCIVVDDEQAAIGIIESYLQKIPSANHIRSFSDSVAALDFVQENDIDLIFLDINMPTLTGLSFLELLKGKSMVILTTAYTEYALEGFKHDVVDYLTKPIAFDRFLEAAQKAHRRLTNKYSSGVDDYIMVKTDRKGKYVRIKFENILYIESLKNYVAIYTKQGDRIVSLLTMKELEERLPSEMFFRTHKSFIISLDQINHLDGGEITLLDCEVRIPLGVTHRDRFFKVLESKIMQ